MKRWFRPIAYSLILILAALAVFGGEAPHDPVLVEPSISRQTSKADPVGPDFARLRDRRREVLPSSLFTVEAIAPVVVPPPAAVTVAPSVPDVKVLGWMLSDSTPYVFVEWSGDSYTLKPTESVGDTYRFERVEAGFADFTYLPTGETRRYTVSDPALLD